MKIKITLEWEPNEEINSVHLATGLRAVANYWQPDPLTGYALTLGEHYYKLDGSRATKKTHDISLTV